VASKGQSRATAAPLLIILVITAVLYGIIALNGWGFGPKLGLDLQGGTSVILTPKATTGGAVTNASVQKAVDIIRQRVNGSGVSEAEVTREGQNILVSIPGADKRQLEQVDKTAQLRFRMVQNVTSGSSTPQPAPSASAGASPSPSGAASATATSSPSASAGSSTSPTASGTPGPTASPSGNGRALTSGLVRQASGSASPAAASSSGAALSSAPGSSAASAASPADSTSPSGTAAPSPADATPDQSLPTGPGAQEALATFAALDCLSDEPAAVALREKAAASDADPTKTIATCSVDRTEKFLLGPAEMVGTDVKGSFATLDQQTNGWIVQLQLNGNGRKKFTKLTTANVGKRFAIVLDGLVESAPTINSAITGDATISGGSFTKKSSNDLANVLKYGALPLSFERSSTDQISPTLGKKSLHAGLVAGFLGLGIVVLYVLAYYRGLGLVTVLGLLLFAALNYALVVILGNTMGFTLTMAGIAGLIVSVGITADSYVVFYERLKDEVREGRSLRGSVDRGFARAWRTIISADTVSFLAAAILYWLSIGAVRGFAFTLGLSTLLDVVIAWMFTRPLVTMLSRTKLFSEGRFVGIRSAAAVTAPVRATRTPKEA
jgi:preprotein translocase subunit SecD